MILYKYLNTYAKTFAVASRPQINLSLESVCQRLLYSRALRPKKNKSDRNEPHYFSDSKHVRVVGGKGGDGCVSFLQLWCNERAGPDGGDGGNGGHVIFQSSSDVRNLNHISSTIKAFDGERGNPKECHGKNAQHTIVKVPIGTVVRNISGKIVCDLHRQDLMYVAARGGSGGKGNRFFTTAKENSPKVCEYGPTGESNSYQIELRSMADIGLIGCPNAGKSTLLKAISRAKPKVAPYAFTTLRPHIGIVHYEDFEQVAVADLPGLIAGSHKNKGLGIQFLKHAERCSLLVFVIDVSLEEPWDNYNMLIYELKQFSAKLANRPKLILANKIDVEGAAERVLEFENKIDDAIIPISAKKGTNIEHLLLKIRQYHDEHKADEFSKYNKV